MLEHYLHGYKISLVECISEVRSALIAISIVAQKNPRN